LEDRTHRFALSNDTNRRRASTRHLNLPENIDNRVWPLLTKLKHRDDHLGAIFVPAYGVVY
jgi:hypothetical protein